MSRLQSIVMASAQSFELLENRREDRMPVRAELRSLSGGCWICPVNFGVTVPGGIKHGYRPVVTIDALLR
jgi:hypothetical protein